MIAVDTNILVYAHRQETQFHAKAYAVIETLAQGREPWGIPAPCIHEFLAITTNKKIFKPASTTQQAVNQINAWLASPSISLLHSGVLHWQTLAQLSLNAHLEGGQFHDARIAAICLEHQVTQLYTADRDFGRFPTLKVKNPLITA